MEEPFLFIAGHPALDFLNTEKRNNAGERVELLTSPERLQEWFATVDFPAIEADDALLEEARHLRDTVRALVTAATTKEKSAPEESLVALNAILSTGAMWLRLTSEFTESQEPVSGVSHPLLPIARATLELLTRHDLSLVRPCAGTGCVLWFLDTTKNKQRRWCRMATCGNREKVAAHYRRRRSD